MKTVYSEDGRVAKCDKEQLEIMLAAGWSTEPPKPKAENTAEEEKSVVKKRVRKPAIEK